MGMGAENDLLYRLLWKELASLHPTTMSAMLDKQLLKEYLIK
jgi:hypothetical protein